MKIKDLPIELRELALKRQKKCKHGSYSRSTNSLMNAFEWCATPEGKNFWCRVDDDEDVTHYACYPKKTNIHESVEIY